MMGAILFKTVPKWILAIIIKLGLVGYVTKYFKYSSKTLKQTLDEITDNKQLKAVLSYSFGDYGKYDLQYGTIVKRQFVYMYILMC